MTASASRHNTHQGSMGVRWAVRHRIRVLQSLLNRIECGSIEILLPDGQRMYSRGNVPGPQGTITVHHPKFLRRLLGEGSLGFGEMYIDGWWTTPDLQGLLDVIMLNNENMARHFTGAVPLRLFERLRHYRNANSREGSRRNIAHHYDLGNAFYEQWLDQTMAYSSALFRNAQESLGEAQQNKYAAVCDQLALKTGDHILEIGCGWGGFAEYAIRERGVRITGLTLSREQHDFARRRLFDAGLAGSAEILLSDYRDSRGTFDGVVSIEMIEAVGMKYWPVYFSTLFDRLRPGKIAVIQAITIADPLFPKYCTKADFIQKHIFPGGMLPCPTALREHSRAAGLEKIATRAFADSYSRTLREWRCRFNISWSRIAGLGFDNRFNRMWNFYLAASAAGFAARTTDVVQVAYRRPA